jgi:hypothetical protein
MSRSPLWPWLVGSLAALALAGCETPQSGRCCHHCTWCRQPPPPADNPTCCGPAAPATAFPRTQELPTEIQGTQAPTLPAVPDPPPTLPALPDFGPTAAAGPQLAVPPVGPAVQPAAVPPQPLTPGDKRRSLVGKVEPGAEHGTWNLRYAPEPATNRAGGVIKLVSSQPLSGFRTGREVQVEGFVTSYGTEMAFQVEHLTMAPSP